MKLKIITMLLALALLSYAKDLKTKDGKIYKNFTVIKINNSGMHIRHNKGVACIEYFNLPEDIKKKYKKSFDRFPESKKPKKVEVSKLTKQEQEAVDRQIRQFMRNTPQKMRDPGYVDATNPYTPSGWRKTQEIRNRYR